MNNTRIKNRISFILLIMFILGFAGCTTVPITGRRQLSFVPLSQLVTMSRSSYSELISKSKLSTDGEAINTLKRVGARIAESAERFLHENGLGSEIKYYDWEFNLIDADKILNAFCMPGGKIAFYTGIMKLADNEDQIAVVMGHEVAHAIAKHGNERMSQMLLMQMGGLALNQALKKKPAQTRKLFLTAFGVGAQFGLLLPYSRKHESEADEIGLILMAKAGYEPYAAVRFWEKMDAKSGSSPPEFLSTHPAPSTRIENLKKLQDKANKYKND